jgi:hypothetical protein
VFLFLNRWNQKDVLPIGHDEYDLPGITPLIGMDQDVPEPTCLNCKNDFLERNTSLRLQALVLNRIPSERLHTWILPRCVPFVITAGEHAASEVDRE